MIRRIGRGIAFLCLALIPIGCADDATRAARFSVEALKVSAQKAEQEARLRADRPDSITLLQLRDRYLAARKAVPPKLLEPSSGAADSLRLELSRVLSEMELRGAALAMEAGRTDLAMEQAKWLMSHAAGDTLTMRQAEYVVVGALRAQRKIPEALVEMRRMLRTYPPRPPDRPGVEDPMLALPLIMVELRRQMGDEEGAKEELGAANAHYRSLLAQPLPPVLEAQVRARLVRTILEQHDTDRALSEIGTLERLVTSQPSLKLMEPDVRFSRILITARSAPNQVAVVGELQKFAADYPKSQNAGRALLEAATILERNKQFEKARDAYRAVVTQYGREPDVAAPALYRQAVLEDQLGRWDLAKASFESVPVKYPGTQASAEAPIMIAQRYLRHRDKASARAALGHAVEVYRAMISADSGAAITVIYRANILRCHIALSEWEHALTDVDEMVLRDPGHPYTAQALLQGAKIAKANKFRDRSAAYLRRFLQDYPNSPIADRVRADLKAVSL
jgi:outer membrane protein assembly factor BamD (BamD/ComL family)